MKFNQIEAYRAVMLAGSVSDAAHFLNVSQPGISRLIKDLERSIGFDLFDRIPGRIVPTPEGEAFFKYVQRTYSGIRYLEGAAKDIANLKHDRLRIASFPAASLEVVPRSIVRLNAAYPDLKIRLEVRSSLRILDLVSSRQVDVGIAAFPVNYPGVILERVYEPSCKCVLPAGHPKSGLSRISLEDLKNETNIGISEDLTIGKALLVAGIESNVKIDNLIETTSGYTICKMVEMGLGVGLVDPLAASLFRESSIVAVEFKPDVKFGFAIVLSEHAIRSRSVDKFIKILNDTIKRSIYPAEFEPPERPDT
ncbi:LysR family transcriptional regulator [Mesorhizobium sp. M7A.F.Ca.CA.001.09.2.1]|uniref:LysR family transcriptional regulator n=1 Tax=Mesorhizobium ciceri TaxID=39645 RepID=A0AB38TEU5_9HYPH|nr:MULTISPECIES: LysR family transcriptional regulator [Mesorhizobium]RUY59629.1 LysR family transcriptional regulator [Mesorhizobium sp. M7A.F.Ca.CA.001.13.2.1]MDF3218561.1 LysR family transcriptional regulator [Mesorhizobium ciceri]RUY66763.1 LysR family transcriptional regulator [Mesorhizobium sp. M7A.F.Ca.CA.001.13.1.1]RUY71351.1 LysR family transcriptional regulator [Mesorhizobium sp. M7A.F.Ca.CA.001.05.1.1]RUY76912.1 LysR family transcriptional regulator [Mesorhizobium sp. M7A.F.Ca.CA.00